MRSLIVVGLLALVATASPKWSELEEYTFERYVADYRLSYERGSSEWIQREANFNKRLSSIKAHNQDSTQTWKRGVNHFTDWSDAEFSSYNKAKPNFQQQQERSNQLIGGQSTVKQSDLPRYVDYRSAQPPVLTAIKNQGACGNCYAHAATESIESYFAIKTGQLPVLSVQQITSCGGQAGCGGGRTKPAWDYVTGSKGLNEEWVYPFTNFFAPNETKQATAKCMNNVSKMQFQYPPKANVTGHTQVSKNDATAMMHALATEGPVSIAVAASVWVDYESGILQNNYSNNASWTSLDHAVQLVGYGYDFDLNMNYWIVRNSWGTNYGEDGYIRLARPDVEPCNVDRQLGWTVCGTSGLLVDGCYPAAAKLKLATKN